MVPLMVATLFAVVASRAGAVGDSLGQLLVLVPIYVGFLVVITALGSSGRRIFRLDVPAIRALVFSGASRNSFVVLPLALALPASLSLAPVVGVTQTLVELIGMVIFVRLLPRLVPSPRRQIEPGQPNRRLNRPSANGRYSDQESICSRR